MTDALLYERIQRRTVPLGPPWDTDTITIQVTAEGRAYSSKNGPLELVGQVGRYADGWGWTLYSRGTDRRFATRDLATTDLARAFGFEVDR